MAYSAKVSYLTRRLNFSYRSLSDGIAVHKTSMNMKVGGSFKYSLWHRRQAWGLGGRDHPDFEVGGRGGGLGVVEGVVSGLLRSKGEGREPRTPSFQTRLTPMAFGMGVHRT
jgi:hypothetical protein